MTILVTGGAGYIGSHTCVELLKNGYDVIVVDNLDNSSEEAVVRVSKITGKDVKFYKADIRDRESMKKIFRENAIDAVIHFAGLKAVGESVEKPLMYFDNNIIGTIVLCEAMSEAGVKKLIFSSSATVYGDINPMPLKEDMPTSVTNPYGRTKLMIEEILHDICASDREWSVVLLRYFNPVGAHESGEIGEDPLGIPNNLMPCIAKAAAGKMQLRVFGDDYDTVDGTGVRDYIHVCDLAEGHVKALTRIEKEGVLEIYNLGTGHGTSVLQMIHAFEKASGKKVPYEITERRPGDVAVCYASAEKAKKYLGFDANRTVDDMCRDTFLWQEKNPDGYKK